jgi:preprotein translocase subunit SecD
MKKTILLLFFILSISCKSEGQEYLKKETSNIINKAYNKNIANLTLVNGWYYVTKDSTGFSKKDSVSQVEYLINPKPILLPINFKKSKDFTNYQGFKGLSIYFDKVGIELWAEVTEKAIGKYLVFILNNKILSINIVNTQITNGVSAFWYDDLTDLEMVELKKLIKE